MLQQNLSSLCKHPDLRERKGRQTRRQTTIPRLGFACFSRNTGTEALALNPVECAREVIRSAIAEFGDSLFVLTSLQSEGVVMIDLVTKIAPGIRPLIPIVTIDTGRLPPATNRMIAEVEARYGICIERIAPDPDEVRAMVEAHGPDLFRDSVPRRMLCCNIRKIRPLSKRFESAQAYFTGIRRQQSAERENIDVFERQARPVKINPLADWTEADIARYTADHALPRHPLYAQGYRSIGCDPCTRSVLVSEDERAGRWWWEQDTAKECGLHFSPDGRAERTVDVLLRDLLNRAEVA